MKRLMMWLVLPVAAVVVSQAATVWAIPAFETEFKKTYYKPESTDAAVKKLAAAIDAISVKKDDKVESCNLCHVNGQGKKVRNEYGAALDALLDKKTDKENADKIQEALKTVAGQKSAAGKTFGEILKSGELPQAPAK